MQKISTITYHYVRPIKNSNFSNIKGLEYKVFKKQIKNLKLNFDIISYDDLKDIIINKREYKDKLCMLTFDDGYKDHLNYVLPELIKNNIKGFFFPSVISTKQSKVLDVNKIQFFISKEPDINILYKKMFNFIDEIQGIRKGHLINKILNLKKKFTKPSRMYHNKETVFFKYLLHSYLPKNISKNFIDLMFKKYVTNNDKNFSKELYMSKNDLKRLIQKGMYVGGHGSTHVRLNEISIENQRKEINSTIKFLNGPAFRMLVAFFSLSIKASSPLS